jgi:large subunit ribosomal protein L28
MAKCEICEKDLNFSVQSSHSNRKTARTWKPNLQTVRTKAGGNTTKKVTVCTRCLKSGKVERAI